ncbi:MAG: hypothetical protein QOD99_3225 [Chthoniobacter sp.]|jgi:hypothetical protein|nr:hypothetical protein [Chthoniobacter sp.]
MLQNFFQLNEVEAASDIASEEDLLTLLQNHDRIENAIYRADTFQPRRPRNVIRNRTFNNVSFRSTLFRDVEFRDCTFEDCLFVGSEFNRCEIHRSIFRGCNLHKARLVDTYIDPALLIGVFDPTRHANIGVWVFQQLRSNSLNTHQPYFFQIADWEFRRWLRFELLSEVARGARRRHEVFGAVVHNWAYEFFMGYGHSLTRFGFTSLALFVGVLEFNCWFWETGVSDLVMNEKVAAADPVSRTIYYSVVTLTTLGYGDVTPASSGGMLVAAGEALLGLIWLGTLTSVIVKKLFR